MNNRYKYIPAIDGFSIETLLVLALPLATILYGKAIEGQYAFLRQWDWNNLVWISLAIPFLHIQTPSGLPAWTGKGISIRTKWIIPGLAGVGFGLLDVFVIKVLLHPAPYETLPPYLQPFPYSLFLYPSGAIEIEVFYRLIPLTLAALALRKWATPETGKKLLWIALVLTAIREPLEQWPAGSSGFIAYATISGFAMNFLQGICLVRYGFLSSVAVRLGHYLVFHIALGIFVQYVEKAAL